MGKSISAMPRDDSWTITMAANRLDPATATGGEIGVMQIWRKLVELVPAFGKPGLLFSEAIVSKGIDQSMRNLIVKAQETRDQLLEARARQIMSTVTSALRMLA